MLQAHFSVLNTNNDCTRFKYPVTLLLFTVPAIGAKLILVNSR